MAALTGMQPLCARCQTISLPSDLDDLDWSRMVGNLADISASRETCSLCMILHRAFCSKAINGGQECQGSVMMKLAKRPKPAKKRFHNKPPIKVILNGYEKYLLLFIRVDAGTISPQECVHGNDASDRGPRVVEPQSISCRLLNGSDQSVPSHWQMAQTEILQCQADHACFPVGEVELPTRLVDLSNYANNFITIKNTAEVGRNTKYAALSYCWGISNTFTTTSATLAYRQQGFSPSALPLSLQDALRVAQGLHIQYIWIDALCILQDSEEDWLYESARMASVYKNSFLTIVAANAPDSGDGFFSVAAHRCQIPVEPPHENLQNTSVILDTGVKFKDEPISRRAWALQEWELAPRRLVFTSSSIHYICPRSALDQIKMKPFFPMYIAWLQREEVSASFWDGLVQNYSSRSLTNPADRLPAIEGMAREFDTLLNHRLGRYLAGLWEKQLERSLLWRQGGALDIFLPESQRSRPEKWVAPSWSWASVQGSVDFAFAQTGKSLVDIIGAETTLNSLGNPYGRVISGSLTLSGPCLATRDAGSHGEDSDGTRWLNYKDEWVGYLFLDADPYSQEHHEVLWRQETLYFLGLRSEWLPEQVGENLRGLVLMERSPSLFYRVGAFLDQGESSWFEGAEKRTLMIL